MPISAGRAVWLGRLLLAFAVWMFGCGAAPPACPDPAGCREPMVVARWRGEGELPLDLLFVLDPRTRAVDPEGVAAAIGRFGAEIARSPQALDLHVGVISSRLDDGAPGAASARCGTADFLAR